MRISCGGHRRERDDARRDYASALTMSIYCIINSKVIRYEKGGAHADNANNDEENQHQRRRDNRFPRVSVFVGIKI